MHLRRLWLTDFRNYTEADVSFPVGLTAVIGRNGQGKSNLIEAIGYLATLDSFRGAPTEALVRSSAARAFVRAEVEREGRELLIEAEIAVGGRGRVQVNRQRLPRSRDLLGALRVTVFAPDDLTLIKGGPAERRRYLDDLLVALSPKNDALRSDVDRVLKQRNTLLKQAGGRLSDELAFTLDVWDEKLAACGTALALARAQLVDELAPLVAAAYDDLAERPATVALGYDAAWMADGLAVALVRTRNDDVRRGVSLVGPHRDELQLSIGSLGARTHASQGEQRTLALALRLAGHELVRSKLDTPAVLLLDDVFSELDPQRSAALLRHLPEGQIVLTTAGPLPEGVHPAACFTIEGATVSS
ncbi:MAG: DNA replication/repair protein RecF [Acidimicrobiia bacterium]